MTFDLRGRSFLLTVLMIFTLAAAAVGQAPDNKAAPKAVKDRSQLLAEIAQARGALGLDPARPEYQVKLARLLFQAGDFEKSEAMVRPLAEAPDAVADAMVLAADLDYLFGRYAKAEELLQKVLARNPEDRQLQVRAQVKLLFVDYQTNRYDKGAGLFKGVEGQIKLPLLDVMRAYGAKEPYLASWPVGVTRTEVPFLVTDPLPVVALEVQGQRVYALIDTGADMFVLDNEIAAGLGLKNLSSTTGTFAGGKTAEVGFAVADSLKIGEVTLASVPVSILPTQRFSKGFAGGKYTIGGIVSTGLLKQFLATLDYPHGRLVLRPRDDKGLAAFRRETGNAPAVEVPFVLALSHFMMARGKLDGAEPLTFFVDSGLASEAAFTAPAETLKFAGIPIPETKVDPSSIGGGGGAGIATGIFPIKTLALGPLVQNDLKGEFGAFPPTGMWMLGFLDDGIISHQFLRSYAWTIDFSAMKMIFVK